MAAPNVLVSCKDEGTTQSFSGGIELRKENGALDLFIDGVKQPRLWGRLAYPTDFGPEKLDQYAKAGIKIFFTEVDTAISLCWNGKDEYYYEKYESHLNRLVAKMPDIKLILSLGGTGGVPYFWARDNRDQLTTFNNGNVIEAASVASEKWKKDSTVAYQKFIQHFENSRFAKNIIGYNPLYCSNVWYSHERFKGYGVDFGDFSEPMQQHFKTWVKKQSIVR